MLASQGLLQKDLIFELSLKMYVENYQKLT
jgi:hypothetical protein